jgi:GNAT superfamily N-acetyltransferase
LHQRVEWLESIGQPMWSRGTVEVPRLLGRHPLAGWRTAWCRDELVAVLALDASDPSCWPDAPDGEARYLHKLAVTLAARGAGGEVLEAAAHETSSAGCRVLRLDCAADRPRLRAFYERHGFVAVDEIMLGPYPTARYERLLSTVVDRH